MLRLILLSAALILLAVGFACKGSIGIPGDTPSEAYKRLYVAVKSKNTEEIKKQLTKKTIELGVASAARYKNTVEKAYENGFTATTFSETLPTIRDERTNGDMGAVEVWNSKDSRWEDLPFIREDGAWKLAVGDVYNDTYKSPGLGRDQREKLAANAVAVSTPITAPNMNVGINSVTVPKIPANKPVK